MVKESRSGGKKKAGIARNGSGGGGIGGLIVVGGALAIAGLVAAFTVKKRTKGDGAYNNSSAKDSDPSKHPNYYYYNNNNNNNPKAEDQQNLGLPYVVQASSLCLTDPDNCTASATLKVKKSKTEIDGGEKISDIPISGDSDEENIQFEDELGVVHDKNYSGGTEPLETTGGGKEENEVFVSGSVKEDGPLINSVQEEEEEEDAEKVKENSEGTGQASIELNTDTVWLEESIEGTTKLEKAKQERIAQHKTSKGEQHHLNSSSNNSVFDDDRHQNEESREKLKTIHWHKNEIVSVKEATMNSSKLRIWFLSLLMLVLLLLSFSFTPHKAMSMLLSLFNDMQSTVKYRSS